MEQRIKLTSSCTDCEFIPKVHNAGQVVYQEGNKLQTMFNGLKIHYDSYHSPWMNQIISNLNGHHEPQEELVFYHLMKLLPNDANMIELGCAWAYYSMFFKSMAGAGLNICIEPNSEKLAKGIANVTLNNFDLDRFNFLRGFIGDRYEVGARFVDWDGTESWMPQYSIEKLISDSDAYFDIIHSDIQGAELDMLNGAISVLDRIGFFVISTHGDKHPKCKHFLTKHDFTILVEHSIEESVSADGLILAVNNMHLGSYEKKIDGNLQQYFDTNCKITRLFTSDTQETA